MHESVAQVEKRLFLENKIIKKSKLFLSLRIMFSSSLLCVGADYVFHLIGVRVLKWEGGSAQPDPVPAWSAEAIHDGHDLALEL